MKYLKPFVAISALGAFLLTSVSAYAGTYPIPKVDVYAKSIVTKRVVASTTDDTGQFNIQVPEDTGEYNLFVLDGNMPPVKLKAKDGYVKGRVVVIADDETPVLTTTSAKKPIATVSTPLPKSSAIPTVKSTPPTDTSTIKKTTTVPLLLRPITTTSTKGSIFENL